MTETIWSMLIKLNRLNAEQYKNYFSKFERKIQRYVDFIADFSHVHNTEICGFHSRFLTCSQYAPPETRNVFLVVQIISPSQSTYLFEFLVPCQNRHTGHCVENPSQMHAAQSCWTVIEHTPTHKAPFALPVNGISISVKIKTSKLDLSKYML